MWKTIQVQDAPFEIIDGDRGHNYPKQDELQEEGYCLFLSASNVTKDGFKFKDCQFIDEHKDSVLRKGKLKRFDVVMTTRGTLGNTAFYSEKIPFENIRINSGMVIFRCNSERILPTFLYHFLRSSQFTAQVKTLQSGVAQPQLPIRDINRIMLPLPSKTIQEKVAYTISAYDDLIENNLRRIELLENAACLIYREWFVKLNFPGREHTKIVDGVPDGWSKGLLKDIAFEYRENVAYDTNLADVPYIGLEHIPRKSITLYDWGRFEDAQSTKHKFCKNDILFGKIRAYFHKVGFATTSGVSSADSIVIRPIKNIHYTYVLLSVSTEHFISYATQVGVGAKMPRSNWNVLEQYEMLIPPKALLNALNETFEPIQKQLTNLSIQIRKLKQARDLLLPKLMSGEIAV